MADLDWIFEHLPRDAHLPDRTSAREQGCGFRFTGSPGTFHLFHTDGPAARRALDLTDAPCCDHALVWQRPAASAGHLTAIELKGGDFTQAAAQVESLVLAVRRRLRETRAPRLRESAIVVYRGRLPSHHLTRHRQRLSRQGIDLYSQTVQRGQTADLRPLLARIEPESR
ncbi:MAG: hypothetical protein H6705_10265 [Myxococcales bacterium]|nr:hypothetical protein [Myxococcales bacterium]